MPSPALPMPGEQLAARLSRGLAPGYDLVELAVASPSLVRDGTTGEGLALRVHVSVTLPGFQAQQWQVTVPVDRTDLDPSVNPSAFVTTLRANLEEWWATKDQESTTAAWGRRLE